MPKHTLKLVLIAIMASIVAGCDTTHSLNNVATPPLSSQPITANSEFWQGDAMTIWARLQQQPLPKLETMSSSDPNANAWIKLAIISKRDSGSTSQLANDLIAWRAENPGHPGNSLIPGGGSLSSLNNSQLPRHIAVLLPLQGPLAQQGKTIRNGFLSAYYANLSKTHVTQTINFYDTNQYGNNMTGLYQKAISDGADFVVGPLSKENVQTLTQQGSFSVPTLALNYTDAWGSLPSNLYQFGLSPFDETQQVADKAREAGYKHAVIITTDNTWGQRAVKSLSSRWQANGGTIQEVLYVSSKTDLSQSITKLLQANPNNKKSLEHRHDIDVVFLLTPPQYARQIVPLIKFNYVDRLPIYATSIVHSGGTGVPENADLNGVIFCEAPSALGGGNRLYSVGTDAYILSSNIPRLTTLPNFPIYGATGAMTLNSNHQIYRRLPWTTMQDGHT
jgi:outer membrane PBP1 activator LpoA protein